MKTIKKIVSFFALFLLISTTFLFNCEGARAVFVSIKELKNIIEDANFDEFKSKFVEFKSKDNLFFNKNCSMDVSAINNELQLTCLQVKNKFQQELVLMGNENLRKKTIAKGALKTMLGLWGLSGVALQYYIQIMQVRINDDKLFKEFTERILKYKLIFAASMASAPVNDISRIGAKLSSDPNNSSFPRQTSWWRLTPFIPFGFPFIAYAFISYISGKGIVGGIRDIKSGLDYKAYINKRINDIDQISSLLK